VASANDRAEGLLDEIGELLAIMMRISRRLEQPHEAMTTTQRLALIEVAAIGPLRLSDLASRMDTTPATASRAIDSLEELELVERRTDPADGRAVLLAATPKGKRWSEDRRKLILSILGEVDSMTPLPPRLAKDIAKLNASLREATGHDEVARGAMLAP
jgi:DNA-binding MarR family transcriptional regulator